MLAAAWYALRGHDVAWPLEPAAYDLLAWSSGTARRVQVKTTTVRSGTSWIVRIGQSGRRHAPYDPELVDDLFVVDGDLGCHLIPMAVVGGLTTITLGAYADYAVGRLGLEPE